MPYIKNERRNKYPPENAGELNYIITRIIKRYLQVKGVSYQTMNDIVGALDNAKDEFRRRIQHPYEDNKIQENGDVYYGPDAKEN